MDASVMRRGRDRDQKFADRFDEVFRSAGCGIIHTPFRAPPAIGVAERFVRTVRSECLDWLLLLNQQHLEHVLAVFVAHINVCKKNGVLGRHRWFLSLRTAFGRPIRLAIGTSLRSSTSMSSYR
jgi:transposase InsO family protein